MAGVNRAGSLVIRTPEGVAFSLLLAGPVTRFLAWFVDLCCISALMLVIGQFLGLFKMINPDWITAWQEMAYFVLSVAYAMALEWYWRGQTVGKRLLRLRVTDAQGLRLQPSQVIMRNLLRFVDALPLFYLVGGVASVLSSRSQRLGDMAANTVVIRTPKIEQPDLNRVAGSKYNSLAAYPHLAARLRQLTSPGLANVALEALVRRDEFEAEARLELFAEIAGALRTLVAFPEDAVDSLPDEQYVRNAVEILFNIKRVI